MNANVVAALYEGGVPFVLGVYCILLGYRVVGKKPGESIKYDAWHASVGSKLRVLGPIIVIGGIFLGLRDLLASR